MRGQIAGCRECRGPIRQVRGLYWRHDFGPDWLYGHTPLPDPATVTRPPSPQVEGEGT